MSLLDVEEMERVPLDFLYAPLPLTVKLTFVDSISSSGDSAGIVDGEVHAVNFQAIPASNCIMWVKLLAPATESVAQLKEYSDVIW